MSDILNAVDLEKRRVKVSMWCCDCMHRSCDEEVYCDHEDKIAYEVMISHKNGTIECSFYEQENES